MADELLYDLDESQRRAVTSPARPLAILAPAGSGKTRVLTRRIAWRVATGDADAPHILAITFTRKAAGELRDRLSRLGLPGGIAAGTFHSVAYAQLRSLWSDQQRPAPSLLSSKGPLTGQALTSLPERDRSLTPAALATEIEWAKARLISPDDYPQAVDKLRRRPIADPHRVAEAYRAYEQLKQRRNLVDFDDLLKLCGDAIRADSAFAAAQRWRFRHLFVDEFQDVNPLQLRLLEAWRGRHHDLCVVGDPQQAIYGWNGADAGFLTDFRTRYPAADVVRLNHNYRSTPQVLAAAQHVLHRARLDNHPARATRADGDAPRVTRYPTDVDEATGIARSVRDLRAPRRSWSDQAVLVRTHNQVELITRALRTAGIPHRVRGGAGLLDDPDVRAALDIIRGDFRPLAACLPDLAAMLAETGTDGTGGTDDDPQPDEALGPAAEPPLAEFVDLARQHHQLAPQATAADFATWARATLQSEDYGQRDAVTVATFHAAKGLEWPIVHLAGVEDGFSPIRHARTAAARAEEARLLYVAMTRALRTLSCTWATQRSFNGRTVDRRLSPWLERLDEATVLAHVDGTTDTVDLATTAHAAEADAGAQLSLGWAPARKDITEQIAEQRRVLAAARPAPDPALAAVLAWREQTARAARVAPDTIVHDDLLEAVVAAMPTDRAQLEAVGISPLLAARLGDGLLNALREGTHSSDRDVADGGRRTNT